MSSFLRLFIASLAVISVTLRAVQFATVISGCPYKNCVGAMTDTRHGANTKQAAPLKPPPEEPGEEKPGGDRTKPRQKKTGRRGGCAGDEDSVGGRRLGSSEDGCCWVRSARLYKFRRWRLLSRDMFAVKVFK